MNKQLLQTVQEENLKEEETRKFLEDSFRNGEIKTTGTDLDKIMPTVNVMARGGRHEILPILWRSTQRRYALLPQMWETF